jgi:lysophospholipase L1-like esterase
VVNAGHTDTTGPLPGVPRRRLRFAVALLASVVAGALMGVMLAVGLISELDTPVTRTTVRPLRVLALGDSITAGTGSTSRSGYRTDLHARLTAAGLDVDFVGSQRSGVGPDLDHEGHGGWTINRVRGGLDSMLATYRPDVVLLHVGTNDITRGEDARKVAGRLSQLIDRIRVARPTAYVIVSQIVGSNVPIERLVDRLYNARLPAIVAAKGPMVRLVDQSTVFGTDLHDLHHPNDLGYAKMAFNFYNALAEVYNVAGPPWPPGVNPYRQSTQVALPVR